MTYTQRKTSKVISRDDVAIAKWNMPVVGSEYSLPSGISVQKTNQETIKKEAMEAGFTQGYEAGFSKGQYEASQIAERVRYVVSILENPLQLVGKAVSENILTMVTVVTRQCIANELATSPELIINVIDQVKQCLPNTEDEVSFILNREDEQTVRRVFQEHGLTLDKMKLVVDDSLTRGEVKVQSKSSEIDATVTARMNAVAEKVFKNE